MRRDLDIAIIGISGLFPGADTVADYWKNLKDGKISITDIPEERWEQSRFMTDDSNEKFKIYCNAGGFIENNKKFDYEYFNMTKEEAIVLDPQQRVMLQLTKKLFDQAGYSKKDYYGKNIAVYMGASQSSSNELHGMYTRFFQLEEDLRLKMFEKFGNPSWHNNYLPDSITNLIAGRISHEFNLTGPSMVIDTACSSSLIAVHHACQLLRLEESDMAVAGGIYLHNTPSAIMGFCAAGALSKSGNLRAFDDRADGFVPGEAAGLILLKRLEDAVRDHDYIHAVIRGSVINNDGHTMGVMAPNPNRQRKVITEFYNKSGISPKEIRYMEAHGTGTKIGDLSEFNSLSQVFANWDVPEQAVALGSVKSNIGHSISASGIASIIKIIGMMKDKTIYKQANFEKPNRKLQIEHSPFYIPTENQSLQEFKYAAINSFGFGGTNAHLILENGEAYNKSNRINTINTMFEYPMFIGAHNEGCITRRKNQIVDLIKISNIYDVAFCENKISLEEKYILPLKIKNNCLLDYGEEVFSRQESKKLLLFTGQGSQYFGMAKNIYETMPVFKEKLDYCSELFEKELGISIVKLLYSTQEDMVATERAQAIIFSVGYSLGYMLIQAGLKPFAMIGHSIGEWIAAALAEVVTLEEAVKIVAIRGKLMSEYNGSGGMTAVFAGRDKLDELVKKYGVFYSAFNISHIVVGGEKEKLQSFMKELSRENIMYRELSVAAAFHTPMFEEAAKKFEKELEAITFEKTKIPIIGNVNGELVDTYTCKYWARHLIEPVRFEECINVAIEQNAEVAIECGGNTALINMLKSKHPDIKGIGMLTPKENKEEVFCQSIIEIVKNCKNICLDKIYAGINYNHVDLPEYPFGGFSDSLFKDFNSSLKHKWIWEKHAENEMVKYDVFYDEVDILQDHWDKSQNTVFVRYTISQFAKEALYMQAQAFLMKLKEEKNTNFKLTIFIDKNCCEKYNIAFGQSVAIFMMSFIQQIKNVDACVVYNDSDYQNGTVVFVNNMWLKYDGSCWYKRVIKPVNNLKTGESFKLDKQNILITGGNGNLGKKVCEYLMKETSCNVVVLGRRENVSFNEPRMYYFPCDITDYNQVCEVRKNIEQTVGKIDIIFHFAGLINQNDICTLEDDFEEIKTVIAPKVQGTINLDSVWNDDELQLMVLLSSISATDTKWAKGLADYASANGFLNGFAYSSKKNVLALNYALMNAENGIDQNLDNEVKEKIMHKNNLTLLNMDQVINTFFSCISEYTDNETIHIFENYYGSEEKCQVTVPEVKTETKSVQKVSGNFDSKKDVSKAEFYKILDLFIDEKIDDNNEQTNFMELGLDSLTGIKMIERIKEELSINIYPTVIFEYQTPEQLYDYVYENSGMSATKIEETDVREKDSMDDKVAIVGLALRAPEVENLEDLWDVVKNKKVVLKEISPSHFVTASTDKEYIGGEIKEVYEFDPMFFGISPAEAKCIDPQQRMLLKVAYEALQDASLISDVNKKIGVYVGSEQNTYSEQFNNGRYLKILEQCMNRAEDVEKIKDVLAAVTMKPDAVSGNSMNELAARVSYTFGLRGPSMVVNTACSSSLVALSIACGDIKNGNVHAAVVGGVNLNLSDAPYVSMNELGALSPTNKCRPFDEKADGMMLGEAVVCIALKRYKEAKACGDYIYGIIDDVTTNNNGKTQGITVPTVMGEKEVMDDLISKNPEVAQKIRYIDAHGTATPLGDPVEITAIQKAYQDYTSQLVYIGSSKGNFGHPLAASGIFSLVKGLAIFEHDEIPPVAGMDNVSKYVELTDKFKIADKSIKISDENYCVGINAFGFGGTNAHVVIENYRNKLKTELDFPQLICFSAYSETMVRDFARFIREQVQDERTDIGGIIRKLNQNTRQFAYKAAFVANSIDDLCSKLDLIAEGKSDKEIYRGCVRKKGSSIKVCVEKNDSEYLKQLADSYVKGNTLDFQNRYAGFHTSKKLSFYSQNEYKVNQKNYFEKKKIEIKKIDFCQIISMKEAEQLLGHVKRGKRS